MEKNRDRLRADRMGPRKGLPVMGKKHRARLLGTRCDGLKPALQTRSWDGLRSPTPRKQLVTKGVRNWKNVKLLDCDGIVLPKRC